jgi:hypothetical protein
VEGGEVVGLAINSDPTQAYARMPWDGDPHVHLIVAAGALVVLATTLAWPLAALVRRLRGRPRTAPPAARLLVGAAAALCLGFAAFFAYAIDRDLLQGLLLTGSPLLQAPLGIAAPFTIAALVAVVVAWKKGWLGALGRAHYTAVVLATAVVVAVGLQYNLVGPLRRSRMHVAVHGFWSIERGLCLWAEPAVSCHRTVRSTSANSLGWPRKPPWPPGKLDDVELDRRGAEMLFQVPTERQETASVAIASNESFSGWTKTLHRPAALRRDRGPAHLRREHPRARHRLLSARARPRPTR